MPNTLYTSPRNQGIDFIRGIALLGILVMNIQTYTLFALLKPAQVYELHLDKPETYAPAQFFIHLFVKGQFYTIYSFLFGLGFYLMYKKNQRLGLDARHIFRRRLWVLLFIGVIHAFVFWFGDVLHKYALLGLSLPFFINKSIPYILKWIVGIVLFVIFLHIMIALYFTQTPQNTAESQLAADQIIMNVIRVWKSGSIGEVVSLQWLGVAMLYVKSLQNGLSNFAHYEIMFLVGIIAGKLNVPGRLSEFRLTLIRLGMWIFPAALLMKAISCLPEVGLLNGPGWYTAHETVLCSLAQFISIPVLTLVYLVEMGLLLQNRSSRIITVIAGAGRMSLTNYLMQTLICMVLFYGYAGGLAGKLTLLESVLAALIIYVFQLTFSTFWLRFYRSGPLEALLKYAVGRPRATAVEVKRNQDILSHTDIF